MAQRVGRITDVASTKVKQGRVPVSPATVWRWVAEGKFPKPFKLGANVTVWDLDAVDSWIAQQSAGLSA
jgi:prophage regulatory protein